MSCHGNQLEDNAANAAEQEAGIRVLEEWLRLEKEHTGPSLFPGQAAAVAWCEEHAEPLVLMASMVLWCTVLTAVFFG